MLYNPSGMNQGEMCGVFLFEQDGSYKSELSRVSPSFVVLRYQIV
jgi:hypothetical protein